MKHAAFGSKLGWLRHDEGVLFWWFLLVSRLIVFHGK
jgi:hypothetical protein